MVSPNPHRFLTSLSPSLLDTDLHESDIFYSSSPAPRRSFRNPPGILAALPDHRPILFPKPLSSTLPRHNEREYSRSAPARKAPIRSAPVRVPVPTKARADFMEGDDVEEREMDEEMVPPHEMVERGLSGVRRNGMTFSVVEGVGRTLKGRDLRQVRNAVWRQTGFLD